MAMRNVLSSFVVINRMGSPLVIARDCKPCGGPTLNKIFQHPHLARACPSDPGRRHHHSPYLPPARLSVAPPQTRTAASATDALQSRATWRLCVQVDVKEVNVAGTKCFQYTAIDDGTRYRILRLDPRKSQQTSHMFFSTIQTALPFPIRKVQCEAG